MKTHPATSLLLSLLSLTAFAGAPLPETKPVDFKPSERIPKIQIALLLDNSGSMQGLIDQARAQMWRVVNEFANAKQKGHKARVELALYEYGERPSRLSNFTTNLDAVSEQLFGMSIRGGDEYCGQVIKNATQELEWSGNPDDLKLIYIAGNEAFTQGPVDPHSAIRDAKRRGITVNVIHAGGMEGSWAAGALAAGTSFMMINHNTKVATVVAPQDAELGALNAKLNSTYIAYGARGRESSARQAAMDVATKAAAPAALAERVVGKGSANYVNSEWDLVDAKKEKKAILGGLKKQDLPSEMQEMNEKEREAYVETKSKERAEIQAQITKLAAERREWLNKEAKSGPKDSTLDEAMSSSAHRAAEAKAFTF